MFKQVIRSWAAAATCWLSVSASTLPLSIPLDQSLFPPYGDTHLQLTISNLVQAFNQTHRSSLSLAISNTAFAEIRVAVNDSPPPKYPKFGEDTLGLQIPTDENRYLFLHWGPEDAGFSELWYLFDDDAGAHPFVSPTGEGLAFYVFFTPKNGAAVPEGGHAATLLVLAATGIFACGRRRPKPLQSPPDEGSQRPAPSGAAGTA